MDVFEILFNASFWVAAIRIASPLIFATMGELICERAGVLNLGIEGIMVAGAFAGWVTVYAGGDLWTGVAVAALVGAAFGLVHGALTVPFGLSQHVVGIGITLLATSLTYFTYRVVLPQVPSPPRIEPFRNWAVPYLSDLPVVGPALFNQTPLTYLAFITVAVVAWVLYRTPLGLAVRAAGENPSAVESQGLSVTGIRMGAVMVGSALMAVGGAFLTMSAFNSFFFEMVNGRGWICIALVVFGSWRPGKALIGALLFAAFDAYQIRLQQVAGGIVPYQVFLMMPYLLSIAALVLVARRASYPKALMIPYQKGER
ncbi:ABC transporter permease [Mesorhizobium sp. YIM 152430]|uniref:ABC transporter permease n=1 Tax=Mesorhizobium sp. YIM 152430 TaxID=3031761 RepID=UPI0023DC1DE9|nr:ABC transporter permease [Mesorhizobium sp. YIM 152430]MDF1599620.1 ABC transporter permease [Mesorhizobium sp. YIM 152430]